jgi:hypothetical protein
VSEVPAVLYLYAITQGPDPPEVAGLRGAPLRAIGADGMFAIASEHDDLRIEANEDDLWAHENVVEALMDRSAVLPMRFGSLLPDEAAVYAMLRNQRAEFELVLAWVRGAVELGIRAVIEPEDVEVPDLIAAGRSGTPGTSYMLGRLERQRMGADVARRIHEPLASLARDSTSRLSAQGRPVLKASYLVDLGMVDDFRTRVEELDEELREATIVCTGPWPPYSFTSPEPDS